MTVKNAPEKPRSYFALMLVAFSQGLSDGPTKGKVISFYNNISKKGFEQGR